MAIQTLGFIKHTVVLHKGLTEQNDKQRVKLSGCHTQLDARFSIKKAMALN